MAKKFKWTVEFEVDEVWVADGFDMDDEVAQAMISKWLSYSYPWETGARIVKSPTAKAIKKAQGSAVA